MIEFIRFLEFARHLFDEEAVAQTAGTVLKAILEARSARLSDIADKMPGNPAASYKALQRFLARADPKTALWRLFQAQAPFVIGDPTEIPRPQARKTPYVGTLQDGKTRGFWLLQLATPFRGRAIPFSFITYSSETIARESSSRNLNHRRALAEVKALIGEKPLVLDREFSYLEWLQALVAEQLHFVIRLNLGSHPPRFFDGDRQRVALTISPGEERVIPNVFYKGQVRVNLMGKWRAGLSEPLWVMTDLNPSQGFEMYRARMKIDQSFRDQKSLLGLDRVMNQKQARMEQVVALVLLAYAIGLLTGEALRDYLYGEPISPEQTVPPGDRIDGQLHLKQSPKWKLFSGLFLLLKRRLRIPVAQLRPIMATVLDSFRQLVLGPVPTHV